MTTKIRTTACAIALLLAGLLLPSPALGKPPKGGGGGGGSPPPDPEIVYEERYVGLKVMNVDGSNQRTLVTAKGQSVAVFPVWSPDGTQIAFYGNLNNVKGIYKVNVDGSGLTLVTRVQAQYSDETSMVDWSRVPTPDGNHKLVFGDYLGSWSRPVEGKDVFVVNPDGTGLRSLTRVSSVNMLAWTPDGRGLLVGGQILNLGLDAEGNLAVENVTELPVAVNWPRWATQHDWLVGHGYLRGVLNQAPGYLDMEVDPPQWQDLPFDFWLTASMSPDDTQMVFSTGYEIQIGNLDGSGVVTLAKSKNALRTPDWKRPPMLTEEELLIELLLAEQIRQEMTQPEHIIDDE